LNVSLDYLLDDDIDDPKSGIEKDPYLANIRETYGARAENEARILLNKNVALFAGGTLSQEAKDAFFDAVMTTYVTCKEEARKTYDRKKKKNNIKKTALLRRRAVLLFFFVCVTERR